MGMPGAASHRVRARAGWCARAAKEPTQSDKKQGQEGKKGFPSPLSLSLLISSSRQRETNRDRWVRERQRQREGESQTLGHGRERDMCVYVRKRKRKRDRQTYRLAADFESLLCFSLHKDCLFFSLPLFFVFFSFLCLIYSPFSSSF